VLYRLWLIGMAASHLEVITRRGRTQKNYGVVIKHGTLRIVWGWLNIYVFYMMYCFYMYYLLSSPYLLVIGDDRVCGTREQMLLMQVAQVKLSCRERIDLGKSYCLFPLVFEIRCKPLRDFFYNHLFSDYGLEKLLVI